MRGELPPVAPRPRARSSAIEAGLSRCGAVISNRDLQSILIFCAIGFLATINVALRFPDFGLLAGQFAPLP